MDDVSQEEKGSASANEDSNSEEKAHQGLINSILVEMKYVFNNIDEYYKKDKSPKSDKMEDANKSSEVENEGKDNAGDTDSEAEIDTGNVEKCPKSNGAVEKSDKVCVKVSENTGEVNKELFIGESETETEETGSRILTAEKCSEEREEPISKKAKLSNEVTGNDKVLGLINVETDRIQMPPVTPGKRSLRSQVTKTSPEAEAEPTGVKRSARRRSKDSPRESVLQSAIARKEKSFSNLSEEKALSNRSVKVARSARISLLDKLQAAGGKGAGQARNKSPAEAKTKVVAPPKSPRLLSQAIQHSSSEPLKKTVSNVNKFDSEIKPSGESQITCIPTLRKRSHYGSTPNLTQTEKVTPESQLSSTVSTTTTSTTTTTTTTTSSTTTATTQNYTKTGKRRYKPFRGLRYSFITGHPVRKAKPVRRQARNRTLSENLGELSLGQAEEVAESCVLQEETTEEKIEETVVTESVPAEQSANTQDSLEVSTKTDTDPPETQESHVAEVGRSDSPVVADACQPATQKRKLQPGEEEECDLDDEGRKRSRHSNVPSPSPAENSPGPSKPESTAISSGAGTAAICSCQVKSQVYLAALNSTEERYCEAVDTMDERWIGCCNSLGTGDTLMYRASKRVAYQMLCEVHANRLLRHNCCPGCGIFCTQGKFVRCSSLHVYHRNCELEVNGKQLCPHCGLDSPMNDSFLTLGVHKNPVFLPQQKPPKKFPSAKMSFCVANRRKDALPTLLRIPSPPLIPSLNLTLPTGHEVTAEGLPTSLEQDKLDQLLSVACGMRSAGPPTANSPRYTLKNLYSAAKKGESDKLLAALMSGLNPNHQYRECSMGSALHAACAGGHLISVHILLQAGAQLDMMDREQRTPLMLAAMAKHNDVVKYLIKAGACVTLKGGEGQTALHMASKSGNMEACHYLLSVPNATSSLIDCVDDGGWTSLVWAAEHCHLDIVRFLLDKKADPLIRDAEQNIALHWSAYSGSLDITEMLLNYGCQVNSSNSAGDTPLHIGARQNKYDCVLLLLARDARVDLVNYRGETPVNCCISKSCECYVAISLNVQLQALAKPRKSALRILTNDISRGKEVNPIQCVNMEDEEDEPRDYLYVNENCYTSNLSVDRTITSLQSCRCTDRCQTNNCMCASVSIRCWYDNEGRLVPEFNYADPPMLFECNQGCACNRITCKNRVVQNGLTARFQLFRTRGKGWGVRTLRPILKGSYVCEYIGEIISDCEADLREDDSYLFDLDNRDGETYCIDARHYGNIARFINHMCSPNLLPVRIFMDHQDLHFPRIAFFARNDIEAEEELGIPVRCLADDL